MTQWLKDKSESSSSLERDIKGITEDQAGLLASYLNAIRQHVALQQAPINMINANVAAILTKLSGGGKTNYRWWNIESRESGFDSPVLAAF